MVEFKVTRNRIIKYLNRYGFNDPEDFFLTGNGSDSDFIYSISAEDVDFDKNLYDIKDEKTDLKQAISKKMAYVKEYYKETGSADIAFEELMFLIVYIGMFKEFGISQNSFASNRVSSTLNLIDIAIGLKKDLLPIGINVQLGRFKASSTQEGAKTTLSDIETIAFDTFLSESPVYSHHFLASLAKFLNINESDSTIKAIISPTIDIEDLGAIRAKLLENVKLDSDGIKLKSILLLRDYLETEFGITRGKATNISSLQVRIIYDVFYCLKWENKVNGFNDYDRFRNMVNSSLNKAINNTK